MFKFLLIFIPHKKSDWLAIFQASILVLIALLLVGFAFGIAFGIKLLLEMVCTKVYLETVIYPLTPVFILIFWGVVIYFVFIHDWIKERYQSIKDESLNRK